mmetsp:Transcript_34320/g.91746  ORF Transcript_34320/g.91746 Transcript_34320/m.91746 type:complete len:301 (+) Transcript_34320:530-1432(+)
MEGLTAASYWMGPSTSSSGAISFKMFVASRVFCVASWASLPVTYDSMAMRGAMPKARADCAVLWAISASSFAVGSMTRAQSAKIWQPVGKSMKKKELTCETPGAVLITWSAGRIVSAVAWAAPLTIPSAWSRYIIMVPNQFRSPRIRLVASSWVIFRASLRARTIELMSAVAGSMMVAASTDTPAALAVFSTSSRLPRMMRSTKSPANSCPAAETMRGSKPSGRTMRCLLDLAKFLRLYRNCLGITTASGPVIVACMSNGLAATPGLSEELKPATSKDCSAIDNSSRVGTTITFVRDKLD